MPQTLTEFLQRRLPTAERPLLARTVLAVEDSRYVSDALRLLCQRSGALLRRADSLATARRYLRTLRPSIVIVDAGLPDGEGVELIRELSRANPRVDVLLGLCCDPAMEPRFLEAGAHGFLAKPLRSLKTFQTAIIAHLPKDAKPPEPRTAEVDEVSPDQMALRDDLNHVVDMLGTSGTENSHAEDFLDGLAYYTGDQELIDALTDLKAARLAGRSVLAEHKRLVALVQARVASVPPV